METKQLGGIITKIHTEDRDGVKVGIVEGYGATWDIDRGDFWGVKDQFLRGAFVDSINDHSQRDRQIRLKDHHGRTIGGIPIKSVHEDERGIFLVGEINLEVQQGRELMSLVRQKVITDFSIGFSIEESSLDEQEELRTISKATIWEFSLVDEPMNMFANVTGFKSIYNYPIADRETSWDVAAAQLNLQKLLGDDHILRSGCAVQILDVVEGDIKIIPRAVFLAAENIKAEDPGDTKFKTIKQLEQIYAKMAIDSPFDASDKQYYTESEVKELTARQLEKVLKATGCFSKNAVKLLVSKLKLDAIDETYDNQDLEMLEKMRAMLKDLKI